MATRYAMQMIDANGTAIEPGLDGSIYRSETPIPIPNKGDTINCLGREFIVTGLAYDYTHDEKTSDLVAAVTIECRPTGE